MEGKKDNSLLFTLITVLFCTCLLISNICAYKLIRIGPLSFTSGILIFPITYILNDVVSEVYGFRKMKIIIWTGFLMNLLMALYFWLAISMPYPSYFTGQQAFVSVLGNSWRMLAASMLAFLAGAFINAFILSKLKVRFNGRRFMLRAILSTIAGELFDSAIFIFIAFVFVYEFGAMLVLIATQTLLKTIYEIVIFPVTRAIVSLIKRTEKLDTLDVHINYNPFSFK